MRLCNDGARSLGDRESSLQGTVTSIAMPVPQVKAELRFCLAMPFQPLWLFILGIFMFPATWLIYQLLSLLPNEAHRTAEYILIPILTMKLEFP
jgi:hypothetical protein